MKTKSRKTREQFIKDLHYFHPEYELIGDYIGSLDKVTIKCTKCGKVSRRFANSVLTDKRCKTCFAKERTMPLPDKETLRWYYVRNGLIKTSMFYYVSTNTIYRWLEQHEIPIGRAFHERVSDREFKKLYLDINNSTRDLAVRWRVKQSLIRSRGVKLGINTIRNDKRFVCLIDKTDEIVELEDKKELAKFLNVTVGVVNNILSGRRNKLEGYTIYRWREYYNEEI